jgi:glucose-6-phosphate dehydrogenase assembly protein OpcA
LTEETIRSEKLLAELNALWTELAREQKKPVGLLRASSMTLLVTYEEPADQERVRRIVGTVMQTHPSRAILIRLEAGAKAEGRVFAECRKGAGGDEQICSEGIEIVVDEAKLGEVTTEIAALVARDLPVTLWCRGARIFSWSRFEPLFPLAQRVIVDSCSAPDAGAAFAALKELRRHGPRVADLAWTRTTGWREAIAARFENAPADAANIRSVTIRFAGDPAQACARYLKRWIEDAVPGAKVDLAHVAGETGIQQIVVAAGSREMTIGPADARASDASEAELIGEELSITQVDPVFEDLLNRA